MSFSRQLAYPSNPVGIDFQLMDFARSSHANFDDEVGFLLPVTNPKGGPIIRFCAANFEQAELQAQALMKPDGLATIGRAVLDTRANYYQILNAAYNAERDGMVSALSVFKRANNQVTPEVLESLKNARLGTRRIAFSNLTGLPEYPLRYFDRASYRTFQDQILKAVAIPNQQQREIEMNRLARRFVVSSEDINLYAGNQESLNMRTIQVSSRKAAMAARLSRAAAYVALADGMYDVYRGIGNQDRNQIAQGLNTLAQSGLGAATGAVAGKAIAALALVFSISPAGWFVVGAGVVAGVAAGFYFEDNVKAITFSFTDDVLVTLP